MMKKSYDNLLNLAEKIVNNNISLKVTEKIFDAIAIYLEINTSETKKKKQLKKIFTMIF